jgi:hypothetical protein
MEEWIVAPIYASELGRAVGDHHEVVPSMQDITPVLLYLGASAVCSALPPLSPMSTPPPPGVYVPAVLFLDENEDFDVPAIKAHVLRLAKVNPHPQR